MLQLDFTVCSSACIIRCRIVSLRAGVSSSPKDGSAAQVPGLGTQHG